MSRGAFLGLSWGLPGGFLRVRRGKPIWTLRQAPIKSHQFLVISKTNISQYPLEWEYIRLLNMNLKLNKNSGLHLNRITEIPIDCSVYVVSR